MATQMVPLGEILTEAQCKKLVDLGNKFIDGKLPVDEVGGFRKVVVREILQPNWDQFKYKWDETYLSYVICWTLSKQTGNDKFLE